MAYVPKQLPENEENQFGRTGESTPNPTPVGGGSAGSGDAGTAPGVGNSTQFGSNAAKLSDYLDANKSQVGEFGNQVANNLTQGYNQAVGSVDTNVGNFNQQVNQGYAPPNPDLAKRAAENPNEFVKNQADVKGFQSLYNNQYTGPQSFESSDVYANANRDVNKAVQDASLVNTQGGLGSYLNNYMGTANNTPGMNTLDTALLQRSPEARTAIQKAATPYQGLNAYLGDKATAANQNVANAKQQASQTSQDLRNQFTGAGGVVPTFQKSLADELTQARGLAGTRLEAAKKALMQDDRGFLSSKPPSDEVLKDLGLTKEQYLQIAGQANTLARGVQNSGANYGMKPFDSLSRYLTPQNPNVNITGENVATADDYARSAALAQLTGGSPILGDPSKAGTANLDLADVNSAGLMKDLKSQYDEWLASGSHPKVQPIIY